MLFSRPPLTSHQWEKESHSFITDRWGVEIQVSHQLSLTPQSKGVTPYCWEKVGVSDFHWGSDGTILARRRSGTILLLPMWPPLTSLGGEMLCYFWMVVNILDSHSSFTDTGGEWEECLVITGEGRNSTPPHQASTDTMEGCLLPQDSKVPSPHFVFSDTTLARREGILHQSRESIEILVLRTAFIDKDGDGVTVISTIQGSYQLEGFYLASLSFSWKEQGFLGGFIGIYCSLAFLCHWIFFHPV